MGFLHTKHRSLFVLLVGLLAWSSPAFAFWGFGTKTTETSTSPKVAVIHIQGRYPDRKESSLFAPKQSLETLLKRIRKARKDASVKAVLFRFGGAMVGMAKASEIRKAIRQFQGSGKKTYAMLDMAMASDYIMASGCDKVVMTPAGMMLLPGMRSEMMYFKKMMDKLGLIGDFVTIGNFKTAPEPFLRDSMSDGQREQTTSLLNDLFDQMIGLIAEGRKLKKEEVSKLIDQAVFTPDAARKAKLIDRVAYRTDVEGWIRTEIKSKNIEFARKYGKKKAKKPTSLWSMFSMLLNPKKKQTDPKKPKIAVIYAQGQIMYGSSPQGSLSEDGIWSDSFLRMLDKVSKVKNLRAVVLRINSPGGSALASDLIWKRLEQIKKKVPLFVSMGRVAASGGYYMAMGADMIVAEPSTLTGSIGVFGGKVVLRQTLERIGINIQSVSRGAKSGIFSVFSKFSEGERAALMKMLTQVYEDFVRKAAKGRKKTYEELLKLAGGRVWTGRQAKKNGLVDALGSLEDTLRMVKKRTGLTKDSPVEVMTFPQPKSFFDSLMTASAGGKTLPYAKNPLLRLMLQLKPEVRKALLPLLYNNQHVMMWTPLPEFRIQ